MMKPVVWRSLTVAAVAMILLLGAANLFLGNLNQDEGWYLYAAKQITDGRVLYRDFMFTQGPALPFIYGIFYPIVEKLGVAGGRLISALFGLASIGLCAWLAARATKRYAGVVALCALILAGVNVYQSYFTASVKTYSLCAFFLTAGFLALSYSNTRRGASAAFWGGFLLALAACTRLSAGIALPVVGIWLICNREKVYPFGAGGSREQGAAVSNLKSAWLAFGLGGGFVLLVGLGTFFLIVPENTQFALFGYHAGRSPGSLMELLALKSGFISRFVQAYFVFAAGCVLAFFLRRHHRHIRETSDAAWNVRPRLTELLQQANQAESPFTHSFLSLLWAAGAVITLVHIAAPFPYDDYQVFVYPILAAALVATLVPQCPEQHFSRLVPVLLLICVAASFSSPINQEWMVRGRDRIWWNFKEEPDLVKLQRAGRLIRKKLRKGGLLLTQDTYLAVEAGARVPHGMEMGPFCYYPELSREEAEQLNLLNKQMMLEVLGSARAPLAAFSGYGLSIASPTVEQLSPENQGDLRDALENSYSKCCEIPNFGQAHTTLEIFRRNP